MLCFYICTWQLVISSLVVHNVLGSVLPFFRTRLYNSLGCDSDHHFWLIVFLVRRHCTPSMTQQHLSPLSHIFNGVEIKIDQIKKSRCSDTYPSQKIWNSILYTQKSTQTFKELSNPINLQSFEIRFRVLPYNAHKLGEMISTWYKVP